MDGLDEVRSLLSRINDAWLKNPRAAMRATLEDCFAENMTIKGPDFQELGRGREACVKSYEDFLDQATVVACELGEPHIDLTGGTAVSTFAWQMTYKLNDQTYSESGHDIFVLVREADRWKAAWRAMLARSM